VVFFVAGSVGAVAQAAKRPQTISTEN